MNKASEASVNLGSSLVSYHWQRSDWCNRTPSAHWFCLAAGLQRTVWHWRTGSVWGCRWARRTGSWSWRNMLDTWHTKTGTS